MGKLKKMMAGLAALLSLGSVAGNARNVFAASADSVRATIQENEGLKNTPFAKLNENQVKEIWGKITINEEEYDNSIYKLQSTKGAPLYTEAEGYDVPKTLKNYLEQDQVSGLGNGLLCHLDGTVVTYSDVFTNIDGLKDLHVPILTTTKWEGKNKWGIEVDTKNDGKQFREIVTENHPIFDKTTWENQTWTLAVDNEENLVDQTTGKYIKFEEGKLVEADSKDAPLKVDNSVLGLPLYTPPVEIKEINPAGENETPQGTDHEKDSSDPTGGGNPVKEKMSGKKKALIGAGIVAVAAAATGGGVAAYKNKGELLGRKRGRDTATSEVTNKSNIENKSTPEKNSSGKAF